MRSLTWWSCTLAGALLSSACNKNECTPQTADNFVRRIKYHTAAATAVSALATGGKLCGSAEYTFLVKQGERAKVIEAIGVELKKAGFTQSPTHKPVGEAISVGYYHSNDALTGDLLWMTYKDKCAWGDVCVEADFIEVVDEDNKDGSK